MRVGLYTIARGCLLIVWVVFAAGRIAALPPTTYLETWVQAKAELDAEQWSAAAPLYEQAIREWDADADALATEPESQANLSRLRNEFGLVLLRIAWLKAADAKTSDILLRRSRAQLDASAGIAEKLGEARLLGDVYDNLAGWYFVRGAETEVIDHLSQARSHYQHAGDNASAARVLNNLGMMHHRLGELRAAQTALHEGLRLASDKASHSAIGLLHLNSSALYNSLGDIQQARLHAERSVSAYELGGLEGSAMRARAALATHARTLGDASSALKQHSRAQAHFAAQGMHHDDASMRQQIVMDLLQLGRFDEAYSASDQLLSMEQLFDSQAHKFALYATHARVLDATGRSAAALGFAREKLAAAAQSRRDIFGRIELMATLRTLYANAGQIENAIAQAEQTFALIEDQRNEFETLRLGPLWSNKNYAYYAEHVEYLLSENSRCPEQKLAELAFATMERARAVSLRQRRYESANLAHQADATDGVWRDLVQALRAVPAADADEAQLAVNEREFNAARAAYFAASGLTVASSRLPLLLADGIQARLGPSRIALVYFAGPQYVWRWQLRADALRIDRLGTHDSIRSLADAAAREIRRLGKQPQPNVDTLSKTLLSGLEIEDTTTTLLLVAADFMNGLPVAALQLGEESLNARIATVNVPSLSEYFGAPALPDRSAGLALAVFADPDFSGLTRRIALESRTEGFRSWSRDLERLPHSAREARALQALFASDETAIFTGEDAHRGNLFDGHVLRARILHLATHGYFNEDSPDLVGFALSRADDTDDGFISLAEIATRSFPAELVVISACDTARGQQMAGEGSLSLARTFLAQGADSVLSTLWPVDDRATAEFMREFYTALKEHEQTYAQALRLAQLALKANPEFSNSFYWAAYELTSATPQNEERTMPAREETGHPEE